jgi:tRNA nucleotidyltransferase (CCA-adding enzyme)
MRQFLRSTGSILVRVNSLISHSGSQKRFKSTLKTFKLETPLFEKILTDELKLLWRIFQTNNFQLRIAGGAVRDLLIEIEPHDVDLATDALPDQMLEMFSKENVRVLNLKGIKHGTVPVRINDKVT